MYLLFYYIHRFFLLLIFSVHHSEYLLILSSTVTYLLLNPSMKFLTLGFLLLKCLFWFFLYSQLSVKVFRLVF